ncbi:alanyl-tRNA editing protein [Variovorax sp. PCZ-1]|uniref:alanyl-tRNA editing protein n=1 Tax=Variovorax sp. PCZ-1 TaxID=2835533 RepID=UPI001BD03299|nr:alanyl-tRNA editing protein [Variovorax sp. PCZ-1]MBS7806544.1 alanyl-tRNA editing protein [Variovorax sp. PCZ-1]
MTQDLFRQDAYLRECTARVQAMQTLPSGEVVVTLDRTVFYPLGGGQAGDAGWLVLPDGTEIAVSDTRKAKDAEGKPTADIWHVLSTSPSENLRGVLSNLKQGDAVTARIDWQRRHRLMRFHTTTHLLCHLIPQPVNGCSITPDYARMDMHMTDPLDKEALTEGIAKLVAQAWPVTVSSITEAELDANPALVKSMSVSPPRGSGVIRTIRIGAAAADSERVGNEPLIDLQPCGGTHVANTSEIGDVRVVKIEKKSATSRRVVLEFGA